MQPLGTDLHAELALQAGRLFGVTRVCAYPIERRRHADRGVRLSPRRLVAPVVALVERRARVQDDPEGAARRDLGLDVGAWQEEGVHREHRGQAGEVGPCAEHRGQPLRHQPADAGGLGRADRGDVGRGALGHLEQEGPGQELALERDLVGAAARRLDVSRLVCSGYLVVDRLELPGWARADRRELDGWVAELYARR